MWRSVLVGWPLWFAACAPVLAQDQAPRPNLLLIVADDLGWNDVGYHGSRIRTPQIDRLVANGVELDQHYVQPVCTPTRAALITGRYPSRFGPHVLVPSNRRALPPGTETLASALRSVGYDTAIAGKWHLAARFEWGPQSYGFARSYGMLTGAADPWTHGYRKGSYEQTWHRDQKRVDEHGNATELIAREAVSWIEAKREPWFVYVPFTAVHIPVDAPACYKAHYAQERFFDDPVQNESFQRYAAFVTQLDAKVGDLVAALERTDQRERTLLVFTADNGGLQSGGNAYVSDVPAAPVAGSNVPLRGQKAQLYEGGIRVPAFASWPGRLARRKVSTPIHAVDWTPTLCGLAGYRPQRDLQWDGIDVWPLVSGEAKQAQPRTIYWAYSNGVALRHGDWKLIVHAGGAKGKAAARHELFDLGRDPHEQDNLAAREPERIAELQKLLRAAQERDVREVPADLRDVKER